MRLSQLVTSLFSCFKFLARLDTKIEFLKGVGPQKASALNTELGIFTFADLIQHYPFRHEDRTKYTKIREILPNEFAVQIKGQVERLEIVGAARKQRLIAYLSDDTGTIELVWFQKISWVQQKLRKGVEYVVYGKATRFGSKLKSKLPLSLKNTQTLSNLFIIRLKNSERSF